MVPEWSLGGSFLLLPFPMFLVYKQLCRHTWCLLCIGTIFSSKVQVHWQGKPRGAQSHTPTSDWWPWLLVIYRERRATSLIQHTIVFQHKCFAIKTKTKKKIEIVLHQAPPPAAPACFPVFLPPCHACPVGSPGSAFSPGLMLLVVEHPAEWLHSTWFTCLLPPGWTSRLFATFCLYEQGCSGFGSPAAVISSIYGSL